MTRSLRRMSCLVLTATLLVSHGVMAHAQSADEVVERHLAAMGGRAVMEKLTSRVATGAITLSTPGGDVTGTIEAFSKAPNKSRTLIKVDLTQFGVGPVVQDQRFNGTGGYAIDSLNGNREITGDQLELARTNTFASPLLKYKDAGSSVELSGHDTVGERDAYVLRLIPKAGPVARLFVDSASYLILKTVMVINVPQFGGGIEQTVTMSDYRDVDGVKVAFQVRSVNQLQSVSISMTRVEHNKELDDAMFSKP